MPGECLSDEVVEWSERKTSEHLFGVNTRLVEHMLDLGVDDALQ